MWASCSFVILFKNTSDLVSTGKQLALSTTHHSDTFIETLLIPTVQCQNHLLSVYFERNKVYHQQIESDGWREWYRIRLEVCSNGNWQVIIFNWLNQIYIVTCNNYCKTSFEVITCTHLITLLIKNWLNASLLLQIIRLLIPWPWSGFRILLLK